MGAVEVLYVAVHLSGSSIPVFPLPPSPSPFPWHPIS